jgi:hypothetical protein
MGDTTMPERDTTFADLAAMWDRHDPMPEGLIDKVLVAIATENLDAEYELLHLVERSRELDGVRGGAGDATTIAFSGGAFSLLLRVTELTDKFCRVDGWVTPPQSMKVRITQQSRNFAAVVDALGRFEIPQLPTGLTRFFLLSDDESDDSERSFATPTFEL